MMNIAGIGYAVLPDSAFRVFAPLHMGGCEVAVPLLRRFIGGVG